MEEKYFQYLVAVFADHEDGKVTSQISFPFGLGAFVRHVGDHDPMYQIPEARMQLKKEVYERFFRAMASFPQIPHHFCIPTGGRGDTGDPRQDEMRENFVAFMAAIKEAPDMVRMNIIVHPDVYTTDLIEQLAQQGEVPAVFNGSNCKKIGNHFFGNGALRAIEENTVRLLGEEALAYLAVSGGTDVRETRDEHTLSNRLQDLQQRAAAFEQFGEAPAAAPVALEEPAAPVGEAEVVDEVDRTNVDGDLVFDPRDLAVFRGAMRAIKSINWATHPGQPTEVQYFWHDRNGRETLNGWHGHWKSQQTKDFSPYGGKIIGFNFGRSRHQPDYHTGITVEHDGKTYFVWFRNEYTRFDPVQGRRVTHQANAVNIELKDSYGTKEDQHKEKLGIVLSDGGQVESIMYQGQVREAIPEQWKPVLRECLQQALLVSSRYQGDRISVIPRGLKELPEFHLGSIVDYLDSRIGVQQDPKFHVTFLEDTVVDRGHGADAGGLARDYLSDLVNGMVTKRNDLFVLDDESGLLVPKMPEEGDKAEAQWVFERLGKLLMYCFHSQAGGGYDRTLMTGFYFDEPTLAAAFSLTAAEVNISFSELSLEAKQRMAVEYAKKSSPVTQALYSDSEGENLEEWLSYIEGQLAGIFALAKGMKAYCNPGPSQGTDQVWDARHSRKDEAVVKAFADKAQGTIDRQTVDQWFRISANDQSIPPLVQRLEWIQEWVRDEENVPLSDVQKMLKFMTGVPVLPSNKKVTVWAKIQAPEFEGDLRPVAHTCSFTVELPIQPCDRAAFMDWFTFSALANETNYSNA